MPDGSFPPYSAAAVEAEAEAEPRAAGRPGHRAPAGAAPVGRLSDLSAIETAAVLYFRLWQDGETGRARAVADFVALLGTGHGASALQALDRLLSLFAAHGRRPLARHADACPCVGGDEACFARLIADAAEGAREEAMLLASLMIRADMAPLAVAMAEELAAAFRRMALRAGPAPATATAAARPRSTRLN